MKYVKQLTATLVAGVALLSVDTASAQDQPIRFAVVGDTGYIPSYDQLDEGDTPHRTLGDYMAEEAEDWLERNPDMQGFTPTPWVYESSSGGYTQASGMYPVARATDEICRVNGCDFAAMVGDNIYPDGATLGADGIADARRFREMLDKPYGQLGMGVENFTIYAMMGNHDWRISREATMAQRDYFQSHPNFTMPDLFYKAVPKGMEDQLEIFVVDTEMLLASTKVYKDRLDDKGQEARTDKLESWDEFVKPMTDAERNMVDWLEQSLEESTARWKIVFGHHALWSGGGSKFEKAHSLRALLLPALCKHADAYISGDDHMLEAYTDDCSTVGEAPRKPLPLLVSGAGSKYRPLHKLFHASQPANHAALTNHWSKGVLWGFAHITLFQDKLTANFYSTPANMSGRPVKEISLNFERRRD